MYDVVLTIQPRGEPGVKLMIWSISALARPKRARYFFVSRWIPWAVYKHVG